MKHLMVKILLAITFVLTVLFFSNDFGLIDIERTAIITAIAIDKNTDGEYEVTAQIAVPEATDTNSENKRAQITGVGGTVAAAIKDIGNLSGWYPNMNFCNLLAIGKDFENTNVIKVLDYFSKTLRIQDSALVVMADAKAKDILSASTPLDNISSFALQKIIIKNVGFENNIVAMDIKNFCTGYYSSAASSFMPIVSIKKENTSSDIGSTGSLNPSSASGEASSSSNSDKSATDGNILFSADRTALFKKGIKVGELDKDMSFVFNTLRGKMSGATFEIKDVDCQSRTAKENFGKTNFLLTVLNNSSSINTEVDENSFTLNITLNIYCRISDRNSESEEQDYSDNLPLPITLQQKAEKYIIDNLNELVLTSKQTECDFLNLKQKLYRHNYVNYARFKDNFLSVMNYKISANVYAQK